MGNVYHVFAFVLYRVTCHGKCLPFVSSCPVQSEMLLEMFTICLQLYRVRHWKCLPFVYNCLIQSEMS